MNRAATRPARPRRRTRSTSETRGHVFCGRHAGHTARYAGARHQRPARLASPETRTPSRMRPAAAAGRRSHDHAAETYRARLAEVRDLIRRLEGSLAIHERRQSARPDDWGFPGDLGAHRRAPPRDHPEPHRPPVRVEAPDDLRRVRGATACPTAGCVCPEHAPESGFDPSECLDLRDRDAGRRGLTGAPRPPAGDAVAPANFGRLQETTHDERQRIEVCPDEAKAPTPVEVVRHDGCEDRPMPTPAATASSLPNPRADAPARRPR